MLIPRISIDTIHIYHKHSKLSKELVERVRIHCKNFQEHYSVETKKYRYTGRLENLRVTVNQRGIYIKGSISKYMLSNNLETLSNDHIRQFIEYLYLIFEVPPDEWKITRLDIGVNLILRHKVEAYLCLVGGARYKTLNHAGSTLYLKSTEKVICFYDKIKEMKKDTYCVVPEEYRNQNILRVEFRIKKNISKHLKYNQEPTLEKLLDPEFVKLCDKYCKQEFNSINFQFSSINISIIKGPKNIWEYAMLKFIENMGIATFERFITHLIKVNEFKYKIYYSRLRNSVNNLIKKYAISHSNPLVEELIDKFEKCF